MKFFIIAAVALAIALPASAATSSPARTTMTCSYKAKGMAVYFKVYGSDVTTYACTVFNSGFKGQPWYGRVPGRVYGIWASFEFEARVAVYSTQPSIGRLFCELLDSNLGEDEWYRIR